MTARYRPNSLHRLQATAFTRTRSHCSRQQCRRTRCHTATGGAVENSAGLPASRAPIEVEVENTSWTSRRLFASVQIYAPMEKVWGCLTDYENLHTFIPSLAVNECLERRPTGAVLYQVGAQEVALGVKFSAAVTLEIKEHPEGLSAEMCSIDNTPEDCFFPVPRTALPCEGARDISFSMLEGDFDAFRGVWRLQEPVPGGDTTFLTYSVYVQPQKWLPVGLIQGRIQGEIEANLDAVRLHAERLMQQQA